MNLKSFYKEIYYLLPLLLTLLLPSCIYRIDRVNVEGNLRGISKSYIYISKFEGDSLTLIDSVRTSSTGDFKIKLKTESPYFVTIGLNRIETSIILLIQPGEDIRIQIENSGFCDYKVFGSNGSALLHDLALSLQRTKKLIDSLQMVYNLNIGSSKIDSIQHLLDSTFQTTITNHRNYTTNFIMENTFSPVSILALSQAYDSLHPVFDYTKDRKLFRLVDSSLLSAYSSNSMVNAYHAKIQKLDSLYEYTRKRELMFKEGEILPNIGYPLVTGENLFISGMWFRYILIDFWGTWCDGCAKKNIFLKEIYKEYAPKGLVMLQVSLNVNPDSLRNMVVKDSMLWYNAYVPDMYNSKLLDTLKVSSIPSNYITDRWGNIKAVNIYGEKLRSKLNELLPK